MRSPSPPAPAVPKGTYKVRLASHGLDPTDPLTVATLTVTLVEAIPAPAVPPTLRSVDSPNEAFEDNPNSADETWTLNGEHLAQVTRLKGRMTFRDEAGREPEEWEIVIQTKEDGAITFASASFPLALGETPRIQIDSTKVVAEYADAEGVTQTVEHPFDWA